MTDPPGRVVVATDTSVLINLIHIRRLDLLGSLSTFTFTAPDEVVAEIIDPGQKEILEAALGAGHLSQVSITDLAEMELFQEFRTDLGSGEAACIALATSRGWLLATDDRDCRRHADARLGPNRLLNTPGVFVLAIRAGILTITDADAAKAVLEQHRFRMNFRTFAEKVRPPSMGDADG